MNASDSLFLSDMGSLRQFMDGMPVAIGVAELIPGSGGGVVAPQGRIVFYNRRWKELFGFGVGDVGTAAEATERLYPDPEYRAECYRLRQEAVAHGAREGRPARPLRLRVRVADGSARDLLTGTTVIGNRMVVSMEELPEKTGQPERSSRRKARTLPVGRSGSPDILIDPASVAAVVAEGKHARILVGASMHPDRRSLREWESILPRREFSRLDRSTLVRTAWIHAIRSYGRGARLSFAHAAVELDIGRAGRERLMSLISRKRSWC